MPSKNFQVCDGSGFRASIAKEAEPPAPPPKLPRDSKSGERLFTAHETAGFLRVSLSWLAKARMRGDGPPFVKIGRTIRYSEAHLQQWIKSQVHLSTSESQISDACRLRKSRIDELE